MSDTTIQPSITQPVERTGEAVRPGTRAPIRRILWPVMAAGLLTASVVVSIPATGRLAAQSDQSEPIACPTMTDSINRLYRAFFNREPGPAELRDTTSRYRSGQANLEGLASELAESEELRSLHGDLDDEGFVDLVYQNVLQRQADPSDRDFWVTNLDSGYPRGSVMIAFSESEEFVRRTATATPLTGYLRWYPEGVHWYCGVGPRNDLKIRPLVEPRIYADFMFQNAGDDQALTGLQTLLNGRAHVNISEGSLPSGFTDYKWGGMFEGDGDYGSALVIAANADTSWIVVFYPTSIGEQRLGWQLGS